MPPAIRVLMATGAAGAFEKGGVTPPLDPQMPAVFEDDGLAARDRCHDFQSATAVAIAIRQSPRIVRMCSG